MCIDDASIDVLSVRRTLACALLALGLGLGVAGCSFDSSEGVGSGSGCDESERPEAGTYRCEGGEWVAADAGAPSDAERPDGSEDTGTPPDLGDTGEKPVDTAGDTAGDTSGDTGADTVGDTGGDIGPDAGCDVPESWYRDQDTDGYGTSNQVKMACSQPSGYVDNKEDCDDQDDSINPDASESCDSVDNDCDGDTDEGCGCTYDPNESNKTDTDMSHNSGVCINQTTDNSGTCQQPNDFESRTDSESNCDGKDNDCDGGTDEGCSCIYDPSEAENVDTDNSHNAGVCPGQTQDDSGVCQEPGDFEMRTTSESNCDGIDNDCDGSTDEGCGCIYDPGETNNVDTDDSHNNGLCINQTRDASGVCQEPSDFEMRTDTEASCDGKDNDCDGAIDEGCSCTYDPDDTNNADSDGDNQNGVCLNQSRDSTGSCQEPTDYDGTDDEGSVGSGSLCDGLDNDCDGSTDEGCPCIYDPSETDKIDTDDSHNAGVCTGQTTDSSGVCQTPNHFEARNPSETSCADSLDNDCDGATDEGWKSAGTNCSADCECFSGSCPNGTCAHRIFVTSSEFDGALGGLSGGDSVCQNAATQAGLSGTWKALLSDSSTNANSRITLQNDVVDMDSNLVATQANFWSTSHSSDIDRDQNNSVISTCSNCFDDHVWTGTLTDGTKHSNTCVDWSSNSGGITGGDDGHAGDAGDTNSEWVDNWDSGCDNTRHLYCIDGQ